MSLVAEATPCPQPRHGAVMKDRPSVPDDVEPSITLSDASSMNGIRNGKPRRPKKRQSAGWDPTIDVHEDQFVLEQPLSAPLQTESKAASTMETSAPLVRDSPKRTTMFLVVPAQHAPITTSQNADDPSSPRKRRLSSVLAQGSAVTNVSNQVRPMRESFLHREARRRTIYVPNDITVSTIHPGAQLQANAAKSVKPRKSDVFLDLATLAEENLPEKIKQHQPLTKPAKQRASRPSLAGPPRRAPLQPSGRQLQSTISQVDIPGQGGGKENVPPGSQFKPKRLGKKANLVLREEHGDEPSVEVLTVNKSFDSKIMRESSKSDLQTLQRSQAGQSLFGTQAVTHHSLPDSHRASQQSHSNVIINVGLERQRSPSVHATSNDEHGNLQEPTQSSLSVSKPGNLHVNNTEEYSTLSEDITYPEMYEENWLSHQEHSLTQLVNSIFDRAGGYAGNTIRDCERHRLFVIYHKPKNALLHKKLHASLQFGALSIPRETLTQVARVKDDFGQRQRFLDLWTKTYDLESLQLAAEVVVGRKKVASPRNSENETSNGSPSPIQRSKSAAKFLHTFLLQNQDLATHQSISAAGPPSPGNTDASRITPPSAAHSWRRTVLRSLMVIHLLDHGQRAGLFQGRNLFQATSSYKSSLAVLNGLCRLLVPSVGDISRTVHHIGYHITHVQYPLEEFNYPITNLATDLRDGVRLTRLVECLLYPPGSLDLEEEGLTTTLSSGEVLNTRIDYNGKQGASWPLSQHLKVPCMARPQRVYNVKVALAGLKMMKDVDPNLLEGVKAGDIVDGHREKTVRLLQAVLTRRVSVCLLSAA